MTAREMRLLRMAHLRELQHDIAALHLRAARAGLATAEAALTQAQEHARAARHRRFAAAEAHDPEEGLLAWAEVETSRLTAAKHHGHVACAISALQHALEAEAAARCVRKQMEAALESVQRAGAEQARREEQATLDEIARWKSALLTRGPLERNP